VSSKPEKVDDPVASEDVETATKTEPNSVLENAPSTCTLKLS